MKALAYYNWGHTAPVVLTDEQRAAFLAPFGPHQSLADDIREERGADRLVVRCMGSFVAESVR